MAETFINATGQATTLGATIYTVPASTTSMLIGINLANITGAPITASVQIGSTYIIRDVLIPNGSALSVLDGKIVLETTDTLVVTASADTSLDVVLSILEIT